MASMSSSTKETTCKNYIEEYYAKICSGEIVVGDKVRRVYKKLVADLHDSSSPYFYSEKRAAHALEFLTKYCRQSKGKDGGKPLRLMLWQKALTCAIFGFVDQNGKRKYRIVFLIIGRKNGKTTWASGVGNYMLFADGEHGPDVYSAATTRDQAKLSWDEAKKMINKSPSLKKRARTLVGSIVVDSNDGEFKPLSSDYSTKDGLNPHCAIMDEIAAWKNGMDLYNIIVDGEAMREQPLNLMISTAGTIREDIFDNFYEMAERTLNGYGDPEGYKDETFLPVIYELDGKEEWIDEDCWIKANPSIDIVKSRQALREKVERAKLNPMLQKNLLCKDFNVRETGSEAWLSFEDIRNEETFELDKEKKTLWYYRSDGIKEPLPYPRYCIGGADLSSTTDLTSARAIFMVPDCDKIFNLQMYWLPADLIDKRVIEDQIPYDKWHDRGLLKVCEGNKIRYQDVTAWFREIQDDMDIYIPWIGYDSWSATYWVDEMVEVFGKNAMIPIHQGKKTLSNPMKNLGNDMISKMIVYNNNPIDKWCFANTAYDEDKNGNIQPHKTSKATRRIDGFASLLNCYTVFMDHQQEYLDMR